MRILIVEDDAFVRGSMAEILREEGLEIEIAASVDEAEALLARETVSVVLTDLRMPGRSGLELLHDPALKGSAVPVIVITGDPVDNAVTAMEAGAYDLLLKPIEPEKLAFVVRRALQHGGLVDEVHRLRDAVHRFRGSHALAGSSRSITRVRRLVEQVAPTDATVLVTGESGTGKELVAAEIHRLSPRGSGPFVLVNCAAVPEAVFESEFFGHRSGAFSGAHADRAGRFAEASGGTLVLDEVQNLRGDQQSKLLRVLESGEFQVVGESRTRRADVRIVAISNQDLQASVRAGDFRHDLFYRLNVFPIELPPLREHLEDISEIAAEMLERWNERRGAGKQSPSITPEALAVLAEYDWPGNVRELRNVLERALILFQPQGTIESEAMRVILGSAPPRTGREGEPQDLNLRRRLESLEAQLLGEALARAGGRKKEAARILGLDPKNLSYYLRKHRLGGGLEKDE